MFKSLLRLEKEKFSSFGMKIVAAALLSIIIIAVMIYFFAPLAKTRPAVSTDYYLQLIEKRESISGPWWRDSDIAYYEALSDYNYSDKTFVTINDPYSRGSYSDQISNIWVCLRFGFLVLCVLVCVTVCLVFYMDFSTGVAKNYLVTGVSKKEFIRAKAVFCAILSVSIFLIFLVVLALLSAEKFGYKIIFFDEIRRIATGCTFASAFFSRALCMLAAILFVGALSLLICVLSRRKLVAALTIAAVFALCLAPFLFFRLAGPESPLFKYVAYIPIFGLIETPTITFNGAWAITFFCYLVAGDALGTFACSRIKNVSL